MTRRREIWMVETGRMMVGRRQQQQQRSNQRSFLSLSGWRKLFACSETLSALSQRLISAEPKSVLLNPNPFLPALAPGCLNAKESRLLKNGRLTRFGTMHLGHLRRRHVANVFHPAENVQWSAPLTLRHPPTPPPSALPRRPLIARNPCGGPVPDPPPPSHNRRRPSSAPPQQA